MAEAMSQNKTDEAYDASLAEILADPYILSRGVCDEKIGTSDDQINMYRLGKTQEFRVRSNLPTWAFASVASWNDLHICCFKVAK